MPGALEGLRIVDLTTGLAGPIATMTLSDHGADVVKVEPPVGDPQRNYVGSVVTNRGKRSVVLDLDVAAERDRLLALVDTADVLVESFAPGHLAARGLDYASVAPGRPSLVYCSLTGLPAHHRRRRPSRHRPPGPGALGHAVRAARLPRRADLPPRAAAEHRGVVPHGRGRPRRAVRARGDRSRAVGGDVAVPGCARVHHAAVAGRRASGPSRGSRSGSSPARASTSAPTACGCTRCTSPAVGARTAASSGRSSASTRPTSNGAPTGRKRSTRRSARRSGRIAAAGPARPVLGATRSPSRRCATRTRRSRTSRCQQRDVGRGRRSRARAGAPGRHRLPGARRAEARGAGPAARARPAHRRGARGARPRAGAPASRARRSGRSRTRSRGSRSSTSATSSPVRSARCCSATWARRSTSSSRHRATRCAPSPSRSTDASAASSTSSSTSSTPRGWRSRTASSARSTSCTTTCDRASPNGSASTTRPRSG